jgi:hypothetical protein
VNSQTNFPSFTEQQQEEVTSLPVSLQIILEAANPVGAASTTAAINPKIACFIESPLLERQTYFSSKVKSNCTTTPHRHGAEQIKNDSDAIWRIGRALQRVQQPSCLKKERERSLSSDRPRSVMKRAVLPEGSPDSLIATQVINGRTTRVRGGRLMRPCKQLTEDHLFLPVLPSCTKRCNSPAALGSFRLKSGKQLANHFFSFWDDLL